MSRNDSLSISASGKESEDESNYIEIKKEKNRTINIDIKLYEKLITFININNNMLMNMKHKISAIKYSEQTQTEEELIFDDAQKQLKLKEKEIKNLKEENLVLKNELNKYKTKYLDIEKKYNEIKNIFDKQMNEKIDVTNKLNKEINSLNEIIHSNKEKMKNMVKYTAFERVSDDEKLLDKILTYLPFEYYLILSSLNKKIHFHLYYKKRCAYIENKYKKCEKLIKELTTSSIPLKYKIEDEEIINLVKKYTEPHLIPGNKMRYSLFHSLLFIENIVRKPLIHQYDIKKNKKESAKIFFNEIFKVMKFEDNNEITQLMKNQKINQELNNKILTIFKDDNIELEKIDKEIIEYFKNDKYINIKFEFKSAQEIKTLLTYFMKHGLEQEYYNKFFRYLIDEFCDLFFNCYESLNSIKELEIVNIAIDSRYKQTNYLMKEMNLMVTELNNYCETSKNLKETLLKQKNDVEIKYNDCLMLNSSLNQEIINYKNIIKDLNEDKIKIKADVDILKNKMIEDYKKIEKSYNEVNKERKSLINVFIELKNFFINTISFSKIDVI
jgi:hypothetical protein